jgi:hypothetical protein
MAKNIRYLFREISQITTYHLLLENKNIVDRFGEIIKDALMSDAENAELILSPHMRNYDNAESTRYFPKELTLELKENLIRAYIQSPNANPNYLTLISQIRSTSELLLSD